MDTWIFIIAMAGVVGVFTFLTVCALSVFRLIEGRRSTRQLSREEDRLLRDIWDGLQKMESRVTNLETILIGKRAPKESAKDAFRDL